MKTVQLSRAVSPDIIATLTVCDTFMLKFRGLMFTRQLDPNRGILLVEKQESRLNTAIHMLFMRYDITVLWLDREGVVVDKALARRWAPVYLPRVPAKYVVELHRDQFDRFRIGEALDFSENQE